MNPIITINNFGQTVKNDSLCFLVVLCHLKCLPTVRLSVVRRQGNFLFPSSHEAIAFGFAFSFLSKAKSQRFSDIINIHRPYDLAQKSALSLGIVVVRFFSVC